MTMKSCALAILIGFSAACAILMILWSFMMMLFVRQQYIPSNAQLVPDYQANMKLALAIPILLIATVLTFSLKLSSGYSAGTIWVMSILALVGVASIIRNDFIVLVFPGYAIISGVLPSSSITSLFSGNLEKFDRVWFMIPLGLLMLYGGLQWIFNIEKDRLFYRQESLKKINNLSENASTANDQGYARKLNFYDYSLNRATTQEIKPDRLLPFLFGPSTHWSQPLLSFILLAVFIVGYMMFLDIVQYALIALMFGLSLIFCVRIVHVCWAFYGRRQEQSLVSMTPLVTSNQEITRLILNSVLKNIYAFWTSNFVFTIIVCTTTEVSSAIFRIAFLCCFGSLLFIHCLLKNHAVKSQLHETGFMVTMLVFIAYVGISMTLRMRFDQFNIAIPCALLFIIHIGLARHQWQQRLHQRALFPVGRAA
ncbi:hypothetical protein ACO0KY_03850 [Undibacterium sp. Dicai25W]|uniref:hypothetical protein n=1 Tax=Undibacterium sp. Dicai25W TaxID=3413034 RepID=UPI003BF2A833